jgi:hypothetical protein
VLGDRAASSAPFPIKTGDCFRLGSVGLVVSEMRRGGLGEEEVRMDARTLQFLKEESIAFESQEYMATLAADERDQEEEAASPSHKAQGAGGLEDLEGGNSPMSSPATFASNSNSSPDRQGIANGEKFICYMCYETHNTSEDSLVAPCDCKGDTRYLHVQCLQKWYHSSVNGVQSQVIRTTGNGAPACKICGAAYKTTFRRPDGKKASLLEVRHVIFVINRLNYYECWIDGKQWSIFVACRSD